MRHCVNRDATTLFRDVTRSLSCCFGSKCLSQLRKKHKKWPPLEKHGFVSSALCYKKRKKFPAHVLHVHQHLSPRVKEQGVLMTSLNPAHMVGPNETAMSVRICAAFASLVKMSWIPSFYLSIFYQPDRRVISSLLSSSSSCPPTIRFWHLLCNLSTVGWASTM